MTENKQALGSDLAKLDATKDEDIARQIAEDPDTAPVWSADDFARAEVWHGDKFLGHGRDFKNGRRVGRPKGSGKKELVTLRLDRKILDHFRAGGPGWQTRLNDQLAALLSKGDRPKRAEAWGDLCAVMIGEPVNINELTEALSQPFDATKVHQVLMGWLRERVVTAPVDDDLLRQIAANLHSSYQPGSVGGRQKRTRRSADAE